MIIQYEWRTGKIFHKYWRGWFLLGIIPIFIKQTGAD